MSTEPPHLEIEVPFSPGRKLVSDNRARQSIRLLFVVELRKFVHTGGGIFLPLAMAAIMAITALGDSHGLDLQNATNAAHLFSDAAGVASIFLPLMGALMVTSEFSSKLAVMSFTLTPRRGRVLRAKYSTGALFGLVATLLALALASFCAAVVPYADALPGALKPEVLAQAWLVLTLKFAFGLALGSLFLMTAPAIVTTFAGPLLLSGFLAIKGLGLHSVSKWVDIFGAPNQAWHHTLSGSQWSQIATTFGLWLLVPLLLGWQRVKRHDF